MDSKGLKNATATFCNIIRYNSGFERWKYLISAVVWRYRKKKNLSFVKKIHTGAKVKVQPVSAFSPLFYFKWPEEEELKFIRKNSHLASTLVDVGANVGLFSSHLIDCFQSFYLFESAPATFSALQETTSLNEQVDWHLFNLGIADKKGTIPFMDEGSLSSTNRFISHSKSSQYSLPVEMLDNLITKNIGDIVLKIDVEGFEEKVFLGARKLFERQQVRLVMFERLGRTNLDNISDFLATYNYVIFLVNKAGKIIVDKEKLRVPCINLFAVPEAEFEAIKA
ncbi:MAG: FkbM family methyltransferase [Legionella sp.]|nr:FkbM family methyltransferase [Legionella sp.]